MIRVAQKKTVKKKARGKKAMADESATPEAAPEGAEKKEMEKPAPAPAPASGSDALVFSRDIAPILVANCGGCHITPPKKRGEFDMTSFQKLLTGGAKHKASVIVAGKTRREPPGPDDQGRRKTQDAGRSQE